MKKYICFVLDRPYHVLDSIDFIEKYYDKNEINTIGIITNKYSNINYEKIYDIVINLDLKSEMYKDEGFFTKCMGYLYRFANNFYLYKSLQFRLKSLLKLNIEDLYVYNDCEMINQAIINAFYKKSNAKIKLMDEGIALYYKPDNFNAPYKSKIKSLLFYNYDLIEFGCNKYIDEIISNYPEKIMANKKADKKIIKRNTYTRGLDRYTCYFDFNFKVEHKSMMYISSPIINEKNIEEVKKIKLKIINDLNEICIKDKMKLLVKLHPAETNLKIDSLLHDNVKLIKDSIPVEFFGMVSQIESFVSEYSSSLINIANSDRKCFYIYQHYKMKIPETLEKYFQSSKCTVLNNITDIYKEVHTDE